MILKGNLRGSGKELAIHLMKDENDHVELHELRGFASDDLEGAFKEVDAIRRGTRARKFLYSLSLNPPPDQDVSTQTFENTIERIEKELDLVNQSRAVVFHTKEARRHCHCVWSVIDTAAMKAIPMSNDRYKLMDISRELYREHDWKMPKGFIRGNAPDPKNCTHAEWAQAKRRGKHPNQIKTTIRDCWVASDTHASFDAALKEKGYFLAEGRRGPVAMDTHCEIYSIARSVGKKVKEVRARVNEATLLSTDDRKVEIATLMVARLSQMQIHQKQIVDARRQQILDKRNALKQSHQMDQEQQLKSQANRWVAEVKARQDRYSKGLRGLIDRLTGKHKQLWLRNEKETELAERRDQRERDTLLFQQLAEKRFLRQRTERLKQFRETSLSGIDADKAQFQEISKGQRDVFEFREKMKSKAKVRTRTLDR